MALADLIRAVHARLSRNRLCLASMRFAAVLGLAFLAGCALTFWLPHAYVYAPLAAVIGLLVYALRTKQFEPVEIDAAVAVIDAHFELKDRLAALVALSDSDESAGKRDFIERQIEERLTERSPEEILPFEPSARLKRLCYLGAAAWLAAFILLFLYFRAHRPHAVEIAAIQRVLDQHPDLPAPLKEKMADLAEKLSTASDDPGAVNEALARAEEEVAKDLADAREAKDAGETSAKVELNTAPTPTPQARATATPTPQNAAQEQQKQQDQQQNQEQEKKDQQTQKQEQQQSKDQQQQQQQQEQQGKQGGQGSSQSQQQQQQSKNSQGGQSQNQQGNEKGTGQGQNQGSGTQENKSQQNQGNSGGQGKSQPQQNQAGSQSQQQSGGQDQQKQDAKGEQKQSQSGGEQQKENKQSDKGGDDKQQALNQAQQALNQVKESMQKKEGQQSSEAQGDNQSQNSSQSSQGKSGQRDQNQKGEQKDQGKNSGQEKGNSQEKKQSGKEQGSAESKQQAEQQQKTADDKNRSAADKSAGKSSLGDPNGKVREFNGGGESKYGASAPVEEKLLQGKDEKFDSRFTGKSGEIVLNKKDSKSKTSVDDVRLAKPEAIKDNSEQPIPLEYRDLLR